jgi:hypothetical protein
MSPTYPIEQRSKSIADPDSAEARQMLKLAHIRNMKNPTYKLIVRDLEFFHNQSAMNDTKFTPEKFFQETERARKLQRIRERKERSKKRTSPKAEE